MSQVKRAGLLGEPLDTYLLYFTFVCMLVGTWRLKSTPEKGGAVGGTGKTINSRPLLSLQYLLALLVGDHGCNRGLP